MKTGVNVSFIRINTKCVFIFLCFASFFGFQWNLKCKLSNIRVLSAFINRYQFFFWRYVSFISFQIQPCHASCLFFKSIVYTCKLALSYRFFIPQIYLCMFLSKFNITIFLLHSLIPLLCVVVLYIMWYRRLLMLRIFWLTCGYN